MNINRVANAIGRGKWLIEPRTAMVERIRAIQFLKGDFDNIETKEPELDKPFALKAGGYFDITDDDSDIFGVAEAGSVAIIPICGTIMKYDYCGSPGTDTLSMWLKAAIDSPKIDAIVLLINSGGGSVEGTGEFADLIKEAEKTILAFCDGLMASAAYWIGCAAKEVWASHATVEFGSIGTAVCFMDDSEAMAAYGYKEIYINADSSPDKNQDVLNAIKGDDTGLKENIINPTNEIFTSVVKVNRKGKLKLSGEGKYKEPLTGKVYLSEASIECGLIDGICTLDECVERALTLGTTKKDNNTTLKTTQMATNTEEKEGRVTISESFLEKLLSGSLFSKKSKKEDENDDDEDEKELKKGKKSEKEDDKSDDEDEKEGKKAKSKKSKEKEDVDEDDETKDDDDEEADDTTGKKGKKAKDKKSDDEEMSAKSKKTRKSKDDDDDEDDEDDDDSDEDEIEVNGKTYSLNDPKQARKAIKETVKQANQMIAEKNDLIDEAAQVIKANVAEMKKTDKEIRSSIKSTFTLNSSKRSNKINLDRGETGYSSFQPTEGSYAEQALQRANSKARAAVNKK